jgi:hypothetical protein
VTFKMGQTPYADYSASEFKETVLKYAGKRTLAEKRAEKAARAKSSWRVAFHPGRHALRSAGAGERARE